MKCHNCGFDNEEEAKFCQKCGSEIQEKNKNNKKIFLIIALFLCLIMIFGIIGLNHSKPKDTNLTIIPDESLD